MAGQERIVSVLDIGSTRVKMLIASATGDSLDSILGVGTAPCSSLKRGVVVDMEGVTQAIQTARDEAERMSSYSVSSVIVNVGGTHVTGLVNRGLVAALLGYLGDQLGIDLYLAAIVVFGSRMYQNIAIIRRVLLKKEA